jgi:hypothetical protein
MMSNLGKTLGFATITFLALGIAVASMLVQDERGAQAGGATNLGPTPYLSSADSPFNPASFSYFHLEDFEDHLFNTPGVSADAGGVTSVVFGPSVHDSVDADDGTIDGSGLNGDGYFAPNGAGGVMFTFDANVLGSLPTDVGIVWTDGSGTTLFEPFDAQGNPLPPIGPLALADASFNGETAEDRFLGVSDPGGISAIQISNTGGGMEVDHLQYGGGIQAATPTDTGSGPTATAPAEPTPLSPAIAPDTGGGPSQNSGNLSPLLVALAGGTFLAALGGVAWQARMRHRA